MIHGHQPDDLGRTLFKDVQLQTEPAAAGFARREVALVVAEWALPVEVSDAGELCVSELVTNALVHARENPGTTVRVIVLRRADRLRIEVHDSNPDPPRERRPTLTSESGRGLFIVARFARDHGSYPTALGKAVWAEIAAWPKNHDLP